MLIITLGNINLHPCDTLKVKKQVNNSLIFLFWGGAASERNVWSQNISGGSTAIFQYGAHNFTLVIFPNKNRAV
jgi:hypothetical protein